MPRTCTGCTGLSPAATPPERIAEAGRCGCGRKIVRGTDNTGQHISVDLWPVDAATELLAYTAGRPTFVLDLARPRGLTLTRRTPRQIARKPVGFNRDRIVLQHDCPTPEAP